MEENVSKNRTRVGRAFALVLMIFLAASGLRSQTTAVLKEVNTQKDGSRLNVGAISFSATTATWLLFRFARKLNLELY